MVACMDFLNMADHQLDCGFGLPLRKLARRAGDLECEQLRWLLSPPVQAALAGAFQATAASSLPVERAFAETKRNEAPRLCQVSTAGRSQLLKQFLRTRQDLLASATKVAEASRKATRLNLQSLARVMSKETICQGPQTQRFVEEHADELSEELRRRRAEAADGRVVPADPRHFPVSESEDSVVHCP